MDAPAPRITVTADPEHQGDRVVWIGIAKVEIRHEDGTTESLLFEFGNHPFPTKEEAEIFARRSALDRIEKAAKLKRDEGL